MVNTWRWCWKAVLFKLLWSVGNTLRREVALIFLGFTGIMWNGYTHNHNYNYTDTSYYNTRLFGPAFLERQIHKQRHVMFYTH